MHRLEKQKAIELRKQGKSYNEILKILNMPSKGTLSFWFKNIQLPPDAKKLLAKNIDLARKRGLFHFNKQRTKINNLENKSILSKSKQKIGKISQRELFLIGTALYWGEGYKSKKQPKLSLTNSDPHLIQLFMRFIREILLIPDRCVRTHIHTHPNIDTQKAIRFWTKITKLPADKFRVIIAISRSGLGKRPANSLPYGTLDLRVHTRQAYYTMMGFIEGLKLSV